MNSNRFSARSGESTNGGGTVLNALVSGGRGMQRASSEASVTGGRRANSEIAPVVRAGNALINAANNNNAASSQGSFSPGRNNNRSNNNHSNNNNNRMSVASSGIGSNVNASVNNLASVRGNNNYGNVSNNEVRNALRNIERQNMLEAQNVDNDANLMILNADELAALEHFAMSPGTPSHRNKRTRFN